MKRYVKSAVINISDEDISIQEEMCRNPSTDSFTLQQLSNSDSPSIRSKVAAHPNTDKETLIKLSQDNYGFVRDDVAGNPNTPVEVLRELAEDYDRQVQIAVAKNPNIPADLIDYFAYHSTCVAAILKNPACPRYIVEDFANSDDGDLRYFVAKSKITPEDILRKLTEDPDWEISEAAFETLGKLSDGTEQ